MKQIIEPARSVDVILETEVLVVGSGPGGLAAALAAARAGARTHCSIATAASAATSRRWAWKALPGTAMSTRSIAKASASS